MRTRRLKFEARVLLALVLVAAATFRVKGQPDSGSNVIVTRDTPLMPGRYTARLPVFFPPMTPIMGTVAEAGDVADVRFVAPVALAGHVAEWFYPALSTLLAERRLSAKLSRRLETYVQARDDAESELTAQIQRVVGLPENERQQALSAFARHQVGKLAELEREAELLRREFVSSGTHWDALRQIPFSRLASGRTEAQRKVLMARTLIATAFYCDHLNPVQRELIIEAAIESGGADLGPQPAPFVTIDRQVVFFAPAAARIAVPRSTTPGLGRQLDEFEKLKVGLRRQLANAAMKLDLNSGARTAHEWRTLLEAQTAGLADLERRAEELRVELRARDVEGWPAPSVQWPDDFRLRLEHYRTSRSALMEKRTAGLQRVREETLAYRLGVDGKHVNVKSTQIPLGVDTNYYINEIRIFGSPEAGPGSAQVIIRMRESIEHWQRENASVSLALAAEESTLGAEAARLMRLESMTPQQAVALAVKVTEQSAIRERYVSYHTALLQPGLSQIQRRLLMGLARRQLGFPLPGGEFQPRDP